VRTSGFDGNIVVELELSTRETAPQETIEGVKRAVEHLEKLYLEA